MCAAAPRWPRGWGCHGDGGAIHNLIAPSMKFSSTGNEASLPKSIYLGSKLNMFNERVCLFTSLNDRGFNLGLEYELEPGMHLRGSSDFDYISMGAGLVLEDIPVGLTSYGLRGRVDFNYTQADSPMRDDPTYVLTVSSLGKSL